MDTPRVRCRVCDAEGMGDGTDICRVCQKQLEADAALGKAVRALPELWGIRQVWWDDDIVWFVQNEQEVVQGMGGSPEIALKDAEEAIADAMEAEHD